MFTSEQPELINPNNQTKNELLRAGMPLAKPAIMSKKIGHKEFILLLGVVVALLVVFILWFNQEPTQQTINLDKSGVVQHIVAPLQDDFIKKALVELPALLGK